MRRLSFCLTFAFPLLLAACMTAAQPDGTPSPSLGTRIVNGVAAACRFHVEIETVASLVAVFGGPTASVAPIVQAVCAQVEKAKTGFRDPSDGYGTVRGVPVRGRFLG